MNNIIIYTDGGSRGNPGQAAIGALITCDGKILVKIKEKIGITTNNVAEYTAVSYALDWLKENLSTLNPDRVNFNLDSLLIVNQIIGSFKIKQDHLKALNNEIQDKIKYLKIPINFNYIPRSQNKEADKLVNIALDEK